MRTKDSGENSSNGDTVLNEVHTKIDVTDTEEGNEREGARDLDPGEPAIDRAECASGDLPYSIVDKIPRGHDNWAQLCFNPSAFLALGSPIAFFVSIRRNASPSDGVHGLNLTSSTLHPSHIGPDYKLPTCTRFFNVFHPHDPCAYRMEPILWLDLKTIPPALVAHHDGQLRINYKMKSLGTKIADAWNSLMNPQEWWTKEQGEYLQKIVEEDDGRKFGLGQEFPQNCPTIKLNNGRRVDYILQENPFEEANEYISSLYGHTSYFDLPDVARFIVAHISPGGP